MSRQSQHWETYYEKAWVVRKQLADQFVNLGVTDPFQIIQKMNLVENRYTLTRDDATEKFSFKPKEYPGEERFYPTGKPLYNFVHLGEQIFAQPTYHSVVDFLLDYLDGQKFDAVVELGSGFGEHLIDLFYRGGPKNIPYYAAEYTKSGVDLAKMFVSLNPSLPLVPFYFDYKNPDLTAIKEKGRILVFTSHSIEQVTEISADLFSYLSGCADEVVCIHFEPFGFQIEDESEDKGEASKLQEVVFRSKDWNQNFAPSLFEAHKRGDVKVTFVAKNVMGRELGNPTSVAIWEGGTKLVKGSA